MTFMGLSGKDLKVPLILTLCYFFIYPVMASMLSSTFSFLGSYASMGVFFVFMIVSIWASEMGGRSIMDKSLLKAALLMSLLYFFVFSTFNAALLPMVGFAGQFASALVFFIFISIGIWLVKRFTKLDTALDGNPKT